MLNRVMKHPGRFEKLGGQNKDESALLLDLKRGQYHSLWKT